MKGMSYTTVTVASEAEHHTIELGGAAPHEHLHLNLHLYSCLTPSKVEQKQSDSKLGRIMLKQLNTLLY